MSPTLNFSTILILSSFLNDEIISLREIQEGTLTGSFRSELNTALYEYFYLDKYESIFIAA